MMSAAGLIVFRHKNITYTRPQPREDIRVTLLKIPDKIGPVYHLNRLLKVTPKQANNRLVNHVAPYSI